MRTTAHACVYLLAACVVVSLAGATRTVVGGSGAFRLSGRPPRDFAPAGPTILRAPSYDGSATLQPSPIPSSESPLGGDFIDGGVQGGPANPVIDWSTLSDAAQQYLEEAALTGQGFQSGPALYTAGLVQLDVDLTGLFPVTVRTQGECNDCWANSATEHLQAVLIKLGYLAGPWLSITSPQPPKINPDQPLYHRLSVQQVLDCSSKDGCAGGSVVDAWRWMLAAPIGGVLPLENYPASSGSPESQPCQPTIPILLANGQTLPPPVYQPGAQTAWHVVPPCFAEECPPNLALEEAVVAYMRQTGIPLVAYVDASNWPAAASGAIWQAKDCNSSGLANSHSSHVVQIVGHGMDVATGKRFFLIRNSWGMEWAEGGHIRLEFGQNTCGLMNYVVQVDLPPPMPSPNSSVASNSQPLAEFAATELLHATLAAKAVAGNEPIAAPAAQTRLGDPCQDRCTALNVACYTSCASRCGPGQWPCFGDCVDTCASAMATCNSQQCGCTVLPPWQPGNVSALCLQMCMSQQTTCSSSCVDACGSSFMCPTYCQNQCDGQQCRSACCAASSFKEGWGEGSNPLPAGGANKEEDEALFQRATAVARKQN